MKKNFLKWGAGVVMMLLVTACSNNARISNLLDKLPADADVVMVGDLKTVVESAGGTVDGSKIELPSFITDELKGSKSRDLEDALEKVEESGVDASACALTVDFEGDHPTIVFSIKDEETFIKYIEEEEYDNDKEEDGVTYYVKEESGDYYSGASCIAVTDGVAYIAPMTYGDKPTKYLRKLIKKANDDSFGSTPFADYITEGNAFGMSIKLPKELRQELKAYGLSKDLANFYTGVICVRGNLDSDNAELNFKMFDEDGNEKDISVLEKYMKLDGTINPKALEYLGTKEVLVYALSMKDVNWDKYLKNLMSAADIEVGGAEMAVVKSYLERFDGTIAFGIGLNNGITSMVKVNCGNDAMQEVPMTLVAETKEGKAKTIVSDIKALLDKEQSMTYKSTADGLTIDLPNGAGSINIAAKGKLLVISNHEIKEGNNNPTVKLEGFANANTMFALVLNKDNQLCKDISLKNNITAVASFDAKAMEGTLKLTMDGDNSMGIVGKVAKTIIEISNNADKIQTKINAAMPSRPSYNDYDSYDPYGYDYDNAVDSCVAVDSCDTIYN